MEKQTILSTADGRAIITEFGSDRRHIKSEPARSGIFISRTEIETSYSLDLIKTILDIKGIGWLCNEIEREESPEYVRANLRYGLLSFIDESAFKGKTILDFGCGAGASTVILGRMFPEATVIGSDFLADNLRIGAERAKFYKTPNVSFVHSATPDDLPADPPSFDHIVLSAVYEHLLPKERGTVFPELYRRLKPGGVLFINELPYRWFPIERHTTRGLPLLNYMPDRMVEWAAKRFSAFPSAMPWTDLLRDGIRGGSVSEMKRMLKKAKQPAPIFLEPCRLGIRDDIGLWYILSTQRKNALVLKMVAAVARILKAFTGISMIHVLTLALRKPR